MTRPKRRAPDEPAEDEGEEPTLGQEPEEPEARAEERWMEVVERSIESVRGRTGRDLKTLDQVFDRPTLMTLYKLISNEVLASLDFPLSTGKEANVFRATAAGGRFLCAKIYRVNTATFHDMLPYIVGDPRFQGLKRDRRSIVHAWCQKEYRNLGRMLEAGARVPEPIAAMQNVLLMEYVGTEEHPARLLKDRPPESKARAKHLHDRVRDDYRKVYRTAGLVHADLSEFNVLLDPEGEPVLIDCGQAVLVAHPMAEEFLRRDATNFARFFRKHGVDTSPEAFVEFVRGGEGLSDSGGSSGA